MKKNIKTTLIALFALLPLGMQAQQSVVTKDLYEGTQILNSDFETWADDEGNTKLEPRYWHSFESASGNLASWATGKISSSGTSKGGKYSCQLKSSSIFGIVANGTMTTGQLNAGNMSAASTDNHASLDISSTSKDNYGDPFYALLTSCPDSLVLWVQFSQGTANSDHPYATVSAAITNGAYYQEPAVEGTDYSKVLVGYAENREIKTTGNKWTRLSIQFSYDKEKYKSDNPQAIMLTLSTNADAGQGSKNDILLIDDLELIYTHEIEIPASGYATFTNTVMKNHKVVMPEGLKGYALAVNADGEPYITDTLEAGDVLPYNATLLLEGKADNYTFSTTLYDDAKNVPATVDEGLVPASELNSPLDGYNYFYLTGEGTTLAFRKADTGLKIQDDKALLRVKADKAADSYQHILITPELTGDINDDGQRSIADVTALVNRLLGKQEQSSKLFIPSADVNGDNSTTISDVTELVNILLGKGN